MSFDVRIIADRKIQEAIEEGLFDNLPGKGQPLNLDEDPSTPQHLRLANRILKNANVLPDWVQIDVEIRKAREECNGFFDRVAREYDRRRADQSGKQFAEWYERSRGDFVRAMRSINSDILKLNVLAPTTASVQIPCRIEQETTRFETAFPPPHSAELADPEVEDTREHRLRAYAEERYRTRRQLDSI